MPNGGRGDPTDFELIGTQLLDAFDRCDSTRGWFSCMDAHDLRCDAAARRPHVTPWTGRLVHVECRDAPCTCGADDLRAAFGRLTAALLVLRHGV
jgi:hypothetical protein